MTRQKRRILFYIFSATFLFISPFIIFYAAGRIPDLSTFNFIKTGGIFVKSKTTNLNVFLNNEFQKETSFLSGGAILTNIKIGRYILKIEKQEYKPWYKSVDVLPERVTELRNILILPEKINIELVKEIGGDLISISPDSSRLLFEKKEKSSKVISIFNTQAQKSYLVSQINKNPITGVIWGNNGIILQKNGFFSIITETEKGYVEESIKFPLKNVVLADFYSESDNSIIFLDSNGGLAVLQNNTVKKIRDNIDSFGIYGKNVFFVDKNGFLAKLNIETSEVKIINRPGFFLSDKPVKIKFSPNGDLFMIDSSGGLFFVSLKEENIIHTVAGEVLGAEFDSLGKKLLFWTPTEIKVFWVEPNVYQPFQKEFIIEPIFKLDSGIKEASWFTKDDFHIIIRAENGIYITEIDGRGGRNTIELVNKKIGGMLLDKNLNKLYFSSAGTIETIIF